MPLSLADLEREVSWLASRIGASGYVLPTFGHSEDGARPHVEVDERGYHYVVVERGEELSRVTTRDSMELLFHVFKDTTFALACDYELKHRVQGQDTRRLMFARQAELLRQLTPGWAEREAREHEAILREHPYTDRA